MVYFIFAAAAILAFLGRRNNLNILRIAFVILFAFAALRYLYGNDYANYYSKYIIIQAGGYSPFTREPLYDLLNRITPSFFVLIAVTSALFIYAIYRLLSRELPLDIVWMGLFIFLINPYLFLMNLSALRQCMALCFFIFSLDALNNRKPIAYVLLIFAAAMCHKSAWLLLPVYFFASSKPWKSWHAVFVLLAVFAALFLFDIVGIITEIASWFGDANYLFFSQQDQQNSVRATLLTSLYFFYTLFNLPKLEGKALICGKLYLLSTILGMLAFRLSMLTRMQMYFDIFSIVALPQIFFAVQNKGPIVINRDNVMITLWECINKYAMPPALVLIYLLRVHSFFTNPMWASFFEYHTILELL